MPFSSKFMAVLAAVTFASAAMAQDTITVEDAYARSAGKAAKAGAAFMVIQNSGDAEDRLIGVQSDAAARVELHTHQIDANGVAKMIHVEEGFVIPAGESHILKRGGDHVMFMGLAAPFEQGETVPVTLIFEKAGEVVIEVPVDLERHDTGGHGSHSN
ncbi:copper chaperone PCu(A)C [Ruegeria lacuscaerulensis]|uniref:copper chaperone PCu(A)C n=1 Tax=Ruegeria lacuscaerulensis TaxID=55218 RepID=UPI00147E1EAF|nr:copper chaperone PCu(A)C [Ruegeria lacuscaerulensis]